MSRVYVMSDHTDVIKKRLEQKQLPGLSLVYKPEDKDGRKSVWPYAVTDGVNYGFFEEEMILFWGTNDECPILDILERHGIRVLSSF